MPPSDQKSRNRFPEEWRQGLARLARARQKVPLYASLQDFIPFIRTIEFRHPDYIGDPRVLRRSRLRLELIPIEIVAGQLVSFGGEDLERLRAAAAISDAALAGMLGPYWSAIVRAKQKYVAQTWKLLFGRASTRQRSVRRWLQSLKARIGEKKLEELMWICYWSHEIATHHRAARLAWSNVYRRRILPELYRLNLAIIKARADSTGNAANRRTQNTKELERRRAFLQALTKSQSVFKASLEKNLIYDAALILIERRLIPRSEDDPDRVFKEVATLLRVWNPPAPSVNPRSLKQLAYLDSTTSAGPRTRHLVV